MNKATLLTLPCLLATLLTPVLSCAEELLLYTPKPAEGDQAPASPDQGILVRSITIKRGDTLANLSHKYIGRGSWFPQVLLFNNIKNPDLIITGDKLLVPVPSGQSAASEPKAAPGRKYAKGKKRHGARRAKTQHRGAAKPETVEPATAAPGAPAPETLKRESVKPETIKPETAKRESVKTETGKRKITKSATGKKKKSQLRSASSAEQESFLQAKLAYLAGDYQKSLALFTEFLHKFPQSSSSADAALYRADCLLHLSGQ